MTFENSSGLSYSTNPSVTATPLLELSFDFGGSPGAPRVYSYKFEFTEADATTLNLPDLSTTKTLTCYMTPAVTEDTNVDSSIDISSQIFLYEQTAVIGSATGNNSGIGGTDTSNAMKLVGKKTVLTLLALFGLMTL